MENATSILTWITFLPLVGMGIILCVPGKFLRLIQCITLVTTLLVLLASLALWQQYDPKAAPGEYQFVQRGAWIDVGMTDGAPTAQYASDGDIVVVTSGIQYYVGVDGLSVVLIFLTGLLAFLATFYTFNITQNAKGFHALYLLLVTGMLGVFVSLDLFLFYVFWEVMLLPMYFLIGIWGGPRREYAAIKFFLYTLAGSVLMLVAVLALYMRYQTFSIPELVALQPFTSNYALAALCFWGFFIAFAVKIPMFPFHTWLPDAHVEAPTAISIILAGVLLKLGGYGIFRICLPMFHDVTLDALMIFALFGFINIVYGAMCAMAQTDFKKLVAYSSVSHMGFVLLGMAAMNAEGMNGAYFQMFSHGLNSAMMFMCVGVIYERAHHRDLNRMGGIANQMPIYFALSTIAFFASLGLPGMSGFVSEVMVFLGAFKEYPWIAGMSAIGVVLTAAYILYMIQRVFLGTTPAKFKDFPDANAYEIYGLAPLAVLTIAFGILPSLVIDMYANDMGVLISSIIK